MKAYTDHITSKYNLSMQAEVDQTINFFHNAIARGDKEVSYEITVGQNNTEHRVYYGVVISDKMQAALAQASQDEEKAKGTGFSQKHTALWHIFHSAVERGLIADGWDRVVTQLEQEGGEPVIYILAAKDELNPINKAGVV